MSFSYSSVSNGADGNKSEAILSRFLRKWMSRYLQKTQNLLYHRTTNLILNQPVVFLPFYFFCTLMTNPCLREMFLIGQLSVIKCFFISFYCVFDIFLTIFLLFKRIETRISPINVNSWLRRHILFFVLLFDAFLT